MTELAPDWDDVLRRARRRRRAPLLVVALIATAVASAAALAVVLTRDAGATLPKDADRSNVVVVVQPATGRILVQAAPWKGHDGICYAIVFFRGKCVPRTTRGTVVLFPPIAGYTFDRRVVSGTALTVNGKPIRLIVRRFEGKVDATFFVTRGRLPRLVQAVVLRDANGRVVLRWQHR